MNPRKIKLLRATPEILASLFSMRDSRNYAFGVEGMPDDAEIVDVRMEPLYGTTGYVVFTVQSETFDEVSDGQMPPDMMLRFTQIVNPDDKATAGYRTHPGRKEYL